MRKRPAPSVRCSVVKVQGGEARRTFDDLAAEEPLEIRLIPHGEQPPGQAVAVTMRTPGRDFELAAGFLFTESILPGRDAIRSISYCVSNEDGDQQYNIVNVWLKPGAAFDNSRLQRNFAMTSACGVCGKASIESVRAGLSRVAPVETLHVSPTVLGALPAKLQAEQALFARTGGLHAAALFEPSGKLVALREDVGRHNAVDKVLGHALLSGVDVTGLVLLVSGRAGFEIVQKAAVVGVPVLAAVGAPSSLAVDLANEAGLTLVGFLREDRFNIYASAERVVEM